MEQTEAIKKMMDKRGFSSVSLSRKLGYASPSGVLMRLRKGKTVTISLLLKYCEAMDYEVVLRSKLKDKDEIVIDTVSAEE